MSAAILPLRNNRNLVEGGCECLSGVDIFENVNPADAIMATMSIAKYHHKEFDVLLQISKTKTNFTKYKIDDGLMKNIRLILLVIQAWNTRVGKLSSLVANKKYLLKNNENPSTANARDLKSLLKCYRTMNSVLMNTDFFGRFALGFEIGHELMGDDNNDDKNNLLWAYLDRIISELPTYSLKNASLQSKQALDEVFEKLKRGEALGDLEEDSDTTLREELGKSTGTLETGGTCSTGRG